MVVNRSKNGAVEPSICSLNDLGVNFFGICLRLFFFEATESLSSRADHRVNGCGAEDSSFSWIAEITSVVLKKIPSEPICFSIILNRSNTKKHLSIEKKVAEIMSVCIRSEGSVDVDAATEPPSPPTIAPASPPPIPPAPPSPERYVPDDTPRFDIFDVVNCFTYLE